MYEIDFTGWERSPETIKQLKHDKKYRRARNWTRLYKSVIYRKSLYTIRMYFFDWLFNRINE